MAAPRHLLWIPAFAGMTTQVRHDKFVRLIGESLILNIESIS